MSGGTYQLRTALGTVHLASDAKHIVLRLPSAPFFEITLRLTRPQAVGVAELIRANLVASRRDGGISASRLDETTVHYQPDAEGIHVTRWNGGQDFYTHAMGEKIRLTLAHKSGRDGTACSIFAEWSLAEASAVATALSLLALPQATATPALADPHEAAPGHELHEVAA